MMLLGDRNWMFIHLIHIEVLTCAVLGRQAHSNPDADGGGVHSESVLWGREIQCVCVTS